MTVEPLERARRAQIVDEVRVSTALEGGRAPDAVHELQDRWIVSEITFDELQAEVRRRYPSRADG